MPDGLVHESEEKLRAHFCTRGPPQQLDYIPGRICVSWAIPCPLHSPPLPFPLEVGSSLNQLWGLAENNFGAL